MAAIKNQSLIILRLCMNNLRYERRA
jgi:hypothetical protein